MVQVLALALVLQAAPDGADVDPSSSPTSALEPGDPGEAAPEADARTDADAGPDARAAAEASEPAPPAASVDAEVPAGERPSDPPNAAAATATTRGPAPAPHAGRGLTIAGAVLSGLGLAGRLGIDVFLATAAGLEPREPFGRWSVGPFFMATAFTNAPTLAGVGLLAGGAHRKGRAEGGAGIAPDRRRRRLGIGLLGGGLGLWGLTRALFLPWSKACDSNACAYAYLESSYFLSAGAVIAGSIFVARDTGRQRGLADRTIAVTPLLGPGAQGIALSGRF